MNKRTILEEPTLRSYLDLMIRPDVPEEYQLSDLAEVLVDNQSLTFKLLYLHQVSPGTFCWFHNVPGWDAVILEHPGFVISVLDDDGAISSYSYTRHKPIVVPQERAFAWLCPHDCKTAKNPHLSVALVCRDGKAAHWNEFKPRFLLGADDFPKIKQG